MVAWTPLMEVVVLQVLNKATVAFLVLVWAQWWIGTSLCTWICQQQKLSWTVNLWKWLKTSHYTYLGLDFYPKEYHNSSRRWSRSQRSTRGINSWSPNRKFHHRLMVPWEISGNSISMVPVILSNPDRTGVLQMIPVVSEWWGFQWSMSIRMPTTQGARKPKAWSLLALKDLRAGNRKNKRWETVKPLHWLHWPCHLTLKFLQVILLSISSCNETASVMAPSCCSWWPKASCSEHKIQVPQIVWLNRVYLRIHYKTCLFV